MHWTKRQVKRALGIKTDAALARLFGIGRSAVDQWADDEPIPDARRWWLMAHYPEIFRAKRAARRKKAA